MFCGFCIKSQPNLEKMKKTLLIYFTLNCCFNLGLLSQQITYSKLFYESEKNGIQVNSVVPILDKGYLIAGNYDNQPDIGILLKVNSSGDFQWNKLLNCKDSTHYPNYNINKIIPTNDSCFALTGQAFNKTSDSWSAFCTKIDSLGNVIWSTALPFDGGYSKSTSIIQTTDSGYVMVGLAYNVLPLTDYKTLIVKLDYQGNFLWAEVLSTDDTPNFGTSVQENNNGSIVISGVNNYNSTYLLKLSSSGTVVWSNKYSDTYDIDFVITENGYLLLLDKYSNFSIIEVDNFGKILWSKSYKKPLEDWGDGKIHLKQTSDEMFIAILGDCYGSSIFKVDLLGDIVWANEIYMNTMDMIETNAKELVFFGNGPLCEFEPDYSYIRDIRQIQTDSVGMESTCVRTLSVETAEDSTFQDNFKYTTSSDISESNLEIYSDFSIEIVQEAGCSGIINSITTSLHENNPNVYPNPSSGNLNIIFSNPNERNIILFNCQGQIVYHLKLLSDQNNIDLSMVPKGLYFYSIVDFDEYIFTGKLLLTE